MRGYFLKYIYHKQLIINFYCWFHGSVFSISFIFKDPTLMLVISHTKTTEKSGQYNESYEDGIRTTWEAWFILNMSQVKDHVQHNCGVTQLM